MIRSLSRRHTLALMGGTAAAGLPAFARNEDWAALGADVKAEFKWAWDHYVARAWGKDEINPVSGTSQSFFIEGHEDDLERTRTTRDTARVAEFLRWAHGELSRREAL